MNIASTNVYPPQGMAVHSTREVYLKDLLEDEFHLLFLLRSGNAPQSATEFNGKVDIAIARFEQRALGIGKSSNAIKDCKYAFCALLDEIILNTDFDIRDDWERNPLQLRLFGEHLAGEGFFVKLDNLRIDPTTNIETLEVFYICLLLGFQGHYLLEGSDKLHYLMRRLGQEIASIRGSKPEFAPSWKPDLFQSFLQHGQPLWIIFSLFGLAAIVVFVFYAYLLQSKTKDLLQFESDTFLQPFSSAAPMGNIAVRVRSIPENASLTMKGRAIGNAPQKIMIKSFEELVKLAAVHGEEQAVEKRIRFVSDKEIEVTFLFGEGSSAMAKALGLPRILVFDYGAGFSFDIGKAIVKPVFVPLIERQAETLRTLFAGSDIYICGHTDSSGSSSANRTLSLDRAQAVSAALITRGVIKDKIKVSGYGSDIPVASNNTADGKAMNRRTEVILPF